MAKKVIKPTFPPPIKPTKAPLTQDSADKVKNKK